MGVRIPQESCGVTKSSPAAKIGWLCSPFMEHLLWARLVLSALQILVCIFNPHNSCTMLATLIPILQVRKFEGGYQPAKTRIQSQALAMFSGTASPALSCSMTMEWPFELG